MKNKQMIAVALKKPNATAMYWSEPGEGFCAEVTTKNKNKPTKATNSEMDSDLGNLTSLEFRLSKPLLPHQPLLQQQ